MSKIDYQALRAKAEKATWGDWDSYKPHRGARGYEVRLSSQAIAQHVLKNNAEFIAAFNPKIALALLDERERNQQYIKSRDQENEEIALTVGKLRVELEAAEKRIAELEAEPVSQTYKLNELSGNYPVTPDGWISCSERMPAQDDWILIYSKHGEYMAGQVQGEYVELSDGTLSWLGNALYWMPLPEPPQEVN
ncbi:ead/Ea22-like family protein [Escherichia coli]|nr:ead/Ea22-like family protein [Escherichia coli]MCZ5281261.1 ead/Ea22-like family protein [Escherichia coli]MCZ5490487.1 ead/Ea22-like family protein [Escherichia coli]MCZ5632856.1 ead/Ea22-like family protein [Escherichia coli]